MLCVVTGADISNPAEARRCQTPASWTSSLNKSHARQKIGQGGGKDDLQGVSVSVQSADGMLFVTRACRRIHAIRG
jgi:hypothetical protein